MLNAMIRTGFLLTLASFAPLAAAQTVSHLTGNFTFTGPATFTDSVTTTAESPQTIPPFTITAPSFIFPSAVIATPAAAVDTADGFALTGRYDFLNGTGTAAQLNITAMRPVTVNAVGDTTASEITGIFGVDGTDTSSFLNPVTGVTANPAVATLDAFFVVTYLEPGDEDQNSASASGVPLSIPLTATFPDGGVVVTGPEGFNASDPIPPGNYNLVQSVEINFSNLIPGETIDTQLPEPTCLALLILGYPMLIRNRKML